MMNEAEAASPLDRVGVCRRDPVGDYPRGLVILSGLVMSGCSKVSLLLCRILYLCRQDSIISTD